MCEEEHNLTNLALGSRILTSLTSFLQYLNSKYQSFLYQLTETYIIIIQYTYIHGEKISKIIIKLPNKLEELFMCEQSKPMKRRR